MVRVRRRARIFGTAGVARQVADAAGAAPARDLAAARIVERPALKCREVRARLRRARRAADPVGVADLPARALAALDHLSGAGAGDRPAVLAEGDALERRQRGVAPVGFAGDPAALAVGAAKARHGVAVDGPTAAVRDDATLGAGGGAEGGRRARRAVRLAQVECRVADIGARARPAVGEVRGDVGSTAEPRETALEAQVEAAHGLARLALVRVAVALLTCGAPLRRAVGAVEEGPAARDCSAALGAELRACRLDRPAGVGRQVAHAGCGPAVSADSGRAAAALRRRAGAGVEHGPALASAVEHRGTVDDARVRTSSALGDRDGAVARRATVARA